MTPGFAKPRNELPWLPYSESDRVIINAHNFPSSVWTPSVNGKNPIAAWVPSRDTAGNGTTTLTDLAGSNNGTLTNMDAATDWVADTGAGGVRALDYDRIDDYVSTGVVGIPVDVNLGVSVWVKLSGSTARQAIVVRSNAGYLINWACVYSQGGTQRFGFWNTAGFGPELTTAVVNDTNWHHLYFGRNGSLGSWTVKIALDGAIQTVTTSRNPQSSVPHPMSIGRWGATAAEYFGGRIDDLRIFDTQLADPDIALLYSSGLGRGVQA